VPLKPGRLLCQLSGRAIDAHEADSGGGVRESLTAVAACVSATGGSSARAGSKESGRAAAAAAKSHANANAASAAALSASAFGDGHRVCSMVSCRAVRRLGGDVAIIKGRPPSSEASLHG
jgi:hypothetical protein